MNKKFGFCVALIVSTYLSAVVRPALSDDAMALPAPLERAFSQLELPRGAAVKGRGFVTNALVSTGGVVILDNPLQASSTTSCTTYFEFDTSNDHLAFLRYAGTCNPDAFAQIAPTFKVAIKRVFSRAYMDTVDPASIADEGSRTYSYKPRCISNATGKPLGDAFNDVAALCSNMSGILKLDKQGHLDSGREEVNTTNQG